MVNLKIDNFDTPFMISQMSENDLVQDELIHNPEF